MTHHHHYSPVYYRSPDPYRNDYTEQDLKIIERDLALLRDSIRRKSFRGNDRPQMYDHRDHLPEWGSPSPGTPPNALTKLDEDDDCNVCRKFKAYERAKTPYVPTRPSTPSVKSAKIREPNWDALPREFLPGKVKSPRAALKKYKV